MHDQQLALGQESVSDFRRRMLDSYSFGKAQRSGKRLIWVAGQGPHGDEIGFRVVDGLSFFSEFSPPIFQASRPLDRFSYVLFWAKHHQWGWELRIFQHIGWVKRTGRFDYFPNLIPGSFGRGGTEETSVNTAQLVYTWSDMPPHLTADDTKRMQVTMEELGERWIVQACERGRRPPTEPGKPIAGQKWT